MSRVVFFSCLAYLSGVFVWSVFVYPNSPNSPNQFSSFYSKKVVVTGMVIADPLPRAKTIQLVVQPQGAREKILVQTGAFSPLQYGDRVRLEGLLQKPPAFEDFNYKEYLATKGIFAVMWYPKAELISRGIYPNILSASFAKILMFKHRLQDVVKENFSPPYSALLGAFTLGDQSQLSDELKNQLNVTGLRHIIAISGQHIMILTGMLEAFLLGIGFWKKQAIVLAFLLMVFFIVLTGAEASAVRSGIMAGFFFAGEFLGRMHASFRGLVFAATLMLIENPMLLLHDVGFQLSFLAVLGIIVSYSFFQNLLHKVPETWGIRNMIAMNFSAQVLTLPVLVYNFGYVSLIGIGTNLLILPIASVLLGLGLVFLLAGALWGVLGNILSYPVFFLLYYFHLVIAFFSKLPFAALVIEHLSPLWLLPLYAGLAYFLWKFKQNQDTIQRI